MARGRMINTTVATDKRLAALSLAAEYLYLKTIPHLDRDGLILGDAPVLWARVATRRPELFAETDAYIGEWLRQGLVIAYETPDGRALFFLGFGKNQTGMRYDREPESTIPAPPDYVRTATGLVPTEDSVPLAAIPPTSGELPADIRQSSGIVPAEVKRKEVKRTEAPSSPADSCERLPADVGMIPQVPSATSGRAEGQHLRELNIQVPAVERRPLVNALLDLTGRRALAEIDNELGRRALAEAHETVVALWQMGRRSVPAMQELATAWSDDWRGAAGTRPTMRQVLELASSLTGPPLPVKGKSNGHTPPAAITFDPTAIRAEDVL